jgi:hypothetical protein
VTTQVRARLQGSAATSPTREESDNPELLPRGPTAGQDSPDPGYGLRRKRIPMLSFPVTTELARRPPRHGAERCTEEGVR